MKMGTLLQMTDVSLLCTPLYPFTKFMRVLVIRSESKDCVPIYVEHCQKSLQPIKGSYYHDVFNCKFNFSFRQPLSETCVRSAEDLRRCLMFHFLIKFSSARYSCTESWETHTTILWPFLGTTWVSLCQKRISGLYGASED